MSQSRDMEFFRGAYQVETDFAGETARLPVFYYDASSINAIFPVAMSKLRKILPKKDFHPLPIAPGIGALAITAFNYRDTDIHPYNEVSIAVMMSYKKQPILPMVGLLNALKNREFHAYVHHLPVTTKIALDGGVSVYNYPKFMSEITYEDQGDHIFVELLENGERILALRTQKIDTEPGERVFRFLTYPVKENRAQMADILFRAKEFGMSYNPGYVELELGTHHPIARELDDLIMVSKSIQYWYIPKFQSILYGPSLLE